MSLPKLPADTCSCNANPTVSKFAGCKDGNPLYFDSLDDLPNGACVMYANGKQDGTSMNKCMKDDDCLPGLFCLFPTTPQQGVCSDIETGIKESDRLVQYCVSPKTSDSKTVYSGCPYSDGDNILKCH